MERDASLKSVEEFMVTSVFSLREDEPIAEALGRLRKAGHSGAPVVDEHRNLVGILSESDFLRALANAAFYEMPVGTVRSHMTSGVQTLSESDDVFTATRRLMDSGHGRMPVVDNGKLVGLVSRRDLEDALYKVQKERDAAKRDLHVAGAAWDVESTRERERKREKNRTTE